jgi:hypothetical protein
MNKLINGTASHALALAGDTASRLRRDVGRWVPTAIKAISAGTSLIAVREGSQKVAKVVRRNPLTTAAAVTVAVGAGIALLVLRRNRRGLDETMRKESIEGESVEVEPIRVARKPVRRTRKPPVRSRVASKSTESTT